MKKLLSLLILLFISVQGMTQVISLVDFDGIKKTIEDAESEFYYPALLKRLVDQDSTLKYQEFVHLYYGSVFQRNYQPYGVSNLKKKFLEEYNAKAYEKAVVTGNDVLFENPVDLEVLLKMSISHLELKNQKEKRTYAVLYFSFLDVIYKSGNGKDINTAYVVISVDDEYAILGDLALRPVNQQLIGDCDVLYFKKGDQQKVKGYKKIKVLFFNVKKPLMSLSKTYKDADLPEAEE